MTIEGDSSNIQITQLTKWIISQGGWFDPRRPSVLGWVNGVGFERNLVSIGFRGFPNLGFQPLRQKEERKDYG